MSVVGGVDTFLPTFKQNYIITVPCSPQDSPCPPLISSREREIEQTDNYIIASNYIH